MLVLGLLLLGIGLTLLALALTTLYIVILVIGAGRLGTIIDELLRKTRKRKKRNNLESDILAGNPQEPPKYDIAHDPSGQSR